MTYDYEIKKLQEALSALESMEVLPLPGVMAKSEEEHQTWMKRCEEIEELVSTAERVALLALPLEVRAFLDQINDRKCQLLQIGKYRPGEESA